MAKTFKQIKEEFLRKAAAAGRKTNNPVIVAMVGVRGAGSSTLARALYKLLGWQVIEKNKIRVALREKGPGFTSENVDEIHYAVVGTILKAGGNVILDSDFVERSKRKKLEKIARQFRAKVFYLHLFCDLDVLIDRILRDRYNPKTNIFKSSTIAVREFARRLPWHYRWQEGGGGRYVLRQPGIKFLAEIDTTKPAEWKKKIKAIASHLSRN